MLTAISLVLVLLAIILIFAVLIQPGKSDMIAGMSGISGQFNSVLGSKGASDMLHRITMGIAITIIILSVVTNAFYTKGVTGSAGGGKRAMTEGKSAPNVQTVPTNPGAQPKR